MTIPNDYNFNKSHFSLSVVYKKPCKPLLCTADWCTLNLSRSLKPLYLFRYHLIPFHSFTHHLTMFHIFLGNISEHFLRNKFNLDNLNPPLPTNISKTKQISLSNLHNLQSHFRFQIPLFHETTTFVRIGARTTLNNIVWQLLFHPYTCPQGRRWLREGY